MPPLKYILQNSNVEELNTLRGKTIECISLIGLAVGKEKVCPFLFYFWFISCLSVYNFFSNLLKQSLVFFMFYLQFAKDANEIMQMLLANQAQFEHISTDDPQVCKLFYLVKLVSDPLISES